MKKFCILLYITFVFVYYAGAEEMKSNDVIVEILIGSEKAEGIIYDNNAGRSFLSLLPLTLKMSDYNNTEKIGKIWKRIDTNGLPLSYDPNVSDIAYYEPFGNLCFFYRDFGLSNSLYSIGRLTKGIDIFADQKQDFEITIKRK